MTHKIELIYECKLMTIGFFTVCKTNTARILKKIILKIYQELYMRTCKLPVARSEHFIDPPGTPHSLKAVYHFPRNS
jgi:hypothetical protein